jgi:DNA ligase (NAD+)
MDNDNVKIYSDKERIEYLRKYLINANKAYYQDGEPVMTDQMYDRLLKELEKLELKNPELYDPNSPTKKVGH